MTDNKNVWFIPCDCRDKRNCVKYHTCGRTLNTQDVKRKFNRKICIDNDYDLYFPRHDKNKEST